MKKKLSSLLALILILSTIFSLSASAVDHKWFSRNLNPPDEDFAYSLALVGDTQILCSADAGTHASLASGKNYMKNIYGWIVNNVETKKIAHVFGLGDITQNNDTTNGAKEWPVAMAAINQLNGVVTYSMLRGNHDHKTLFDNNFNTTTYKSMFAGRYSTNDVRNTYRFKNIGGEQYLFMTLDYCPSDAVLAWANNVLSNPNFAHCKVIISTHGYMDAKGYRMSTGTDVIWNADCSCSSSAVCSCNKPNYGQQIWDEFVKLHSNIFMVICGHMGADHVVITTDTGNYGNTVYQVLVNPQNVDGGADDGSTAPDPIGTVALLCFSKDGSRFWVEYYSTVKQKYYAQPISEVVYSEPRFVSPIMTSEKASIRISPTNTGLRFKSVVEKSYLESLKTTYPSATISVGTLIVPVDLLKNNDLTHKTDVHYVDVEANIDAPFSSDSTTNTYAGSLVSIKHSNLDRDFVGRGYIKIAQTGKDPIYIYSDIKSTRNISGIAYAAWSDVNATASSGYKYQISSADTFNGSFSPYSEEHRSIIAALIKAEKTEDSFNSDIFN